MADYTLHMGDCLEYMATMPDSSVDLIATDPPYFKVKSDWWDRQWNTADGFLAWMGDVMGEFHRILKPNGSLYVFASPKMAWGVEGAVRERFNVLNQIQWVKPDPSLSINHGASNGGRINKDSMRSLYPTREIAIFAEHYNSDNMAKGEAGYAAKCDELRGFVFEPLRAYLDGERQRAGVSVREVAEQFQAKTGSRTVTGMARHWFWAVQWALPTADNYEWLRGTLSSLNHGGEYLQRPHEELRQEYEELRQEYEELRQEYEELRRPFNATPDAPYTDVWTFPTVQAYKGKHPTEKPLALMEHIVKLSSRPGAVVFDPFMGSGTTGIAAVKHGRNFIGCDATEQWYYMAKERIGLTVGEHAFGLFEAT